MTASLVAHYQALSIDSLSSPRYYTPDVFSARMLPPALSGPKLQILRASSLSHSNSSLRIFALDLISSFAETLPFSIVSARSM
jgi:hypothetical protein